VQQAQVAEVVRQSLAKVISDEWLLVELGAAERALVHQLGLRVRRRIPRDLDFDVDIEYNRQGLDGASKLLLPPRTSIPDLVVHRRGHGGREHNLLVLEAKNTGRGVAHPMETWRSWKRLSLGLGFGMPMH